jgi:hypothetical protein
MCVNSSNSSKNSNYLLRGPNQVPLALDICLLTDVQLSSLFVLISSKIDFTKVKHDVYNQTLISEAAFLEDATTAFTAYTNLAEVYISIYIRS